MLSLFSVPKPFRGNNKIIQTNAIRSWTLLLPKPEIILLGDEEGTSEMIKELNIRYIHEIERNEHGTPLANSVFHEGQNATSNPLVCYINADIILMSDFMNTVRKAVELVKDQKFLLVSRHWDVEITKLLIPMTLSAQRI